MLFRGYGVSDRMRPVHAGLVGADALWLLDEVHLSRPFEETLEAIAGGHEETGGRVLAERPRLAPFAVVKLSATPGAEKPVDWFPGADFDLREGAPKEFLDRLDARKYATLATVDGDGAEAFATYARCFAGLVAPDGAGKAKKGRKGKKRVEGEIAPVALRRVAVVVNRVDLARRVFDEIDRESAGKAEVLLLTGRVRPLDRKRIVEKLAPLFAAVDRPDPPKPIILVATQTVEAGADLDVEALVTEIAPLDSLRQRFGRLDRLGTRRESRAIILCPAGKPTKGESSKENAWTPIVRIYGESAYETKEWVSTLGDEIDFGADAFQRRLDALDKERLERMLARRAQAPVLLPPYVDLWAATSPVPVATPEPSLFLHGPATSADVQVVWRADVDPRDEAAAQVSLERCPPSALEAVPV
ncbi:MAG: hypothetical protein ACREQY_16310, partial [Candidatus Binatia bacterium]